MVTSALEVSSYTPYLSGWADGRAAAEDLSAAIQRWEDGDGVKPEQSLADLFNEAVQRLCEACTPMDRQHAEGMMDCLSQAVHWVNSRWQPDKSSPGQPEATATETQACHDARPQHDDPEFNSREYAYRAGWIDGLEYLTDSIEATQRGDENALSWEECMALANQRRREAKNSNNQIAVDKARGRVHCIAVAMTVCCEFGDSEFVSDEAFTLFRRRSEKWRHGPADATPPGVADCLRFMRSEREAEDEDSKVQPDTVDSLVAEFESVDGFIADYIRHHKATARKQQPVLALAGALAATAAIVGRRVRDEFGTRPNLQIVSVALTSGGKDHARRLNSELFADAGQSLVLMAEEHTSDTAIYRELAAQPSRLWQCDEFGRFLRAANGQTANHLQSVVTALMKLYTSAGSRQFIGKAFADPRLQESLVTCEPHLVLHATTTPDALYESLGQCSVDDGFLGRCLIFETETQPKRQMVPERAIPESMVEFAEAWGKRPSTTGVNTIYTPPSTVPTTAEAGAVFDEFEGVFHTKLTAGGKGSPLWGRAEEKSRQVALVLACSRSVSEPVVDELCARLACRLVSAICQRMQDIANEWLAANAIEAGQQKLFRVIKSNPGITRNQLTRKSQWLKKRERMEYLEDMLESGLITAREEARGRGVTFWPA